MAEWTSSCIIYVYDKDGQPQDLCFVGHNLPETATRIFMQQFEAETGRKAPSDYFHVRRAYGDEKLPSMEDFWKSHPFGDAAS